MNKRRERALEAFLYITFPIALFAGCSGLGNTKTDADLRAADSQSVRTQEDRYIDDWRVPRYFGSFDSGKAVESSDVLTGQDHASETGSSDAGRAAEIEPLQSVFNFRSNDYNVAPPDREMLAKHAEFLAANPRLLLSIIGYADSRGSARYNKRLSAKRAQQVYELLVSYGAPEKQLIVDANGETGTVNSDIDLAESRRVELLYSNVLLMSAER